MSLLDAMFAHSRGLAGLLGGTLMARLSGARNARIIDQIDIQPADHILEVGFAPGAALQKLTSRARAGFIAGVDISPLMLRQATKRNSRAVRLAP
jgi:ubiquinone/menaquinone biosynthesis C-methylase UbiE